MPQNIIGSYYITNQYTFTCDFQATSTFMQKRNQMFFQLNGGTHKFFITRFGFVFQRQSGALAWEKVLDGIGAQGLYYYEYNSSSNPIHSLIVQYDGVNNQLRIYVDNYLVGSENVSAPAINATWQLVTGDNQPYDDFTGILSNVAFTTTATLPTGILTAPTPQYNTYDYPAGYVLGGDASGCDDVFTQELQCVRPTWFSGSWAGAGVTPLGSAFSMSMMLGWDGTGNNPSQQIIDDTIAFSQIFADYYGYRFMVAANVCEFYQFQADPTYFYNQFIDYVLLNPPVTGIELVTIIAQLPTVMGTSPVDLTTVLYTDPVTVLDDNKFIYDALGTMIFNKLGNIPMTIWEDGEEDGSSIGSVGTPQPARTASRPVKYNYMVSDMLATLTNADFEWYDTYDQRFINNDGRWIDYDYTCSNTGYGQVSMYSRTPAEWYDWNGERRGLNFIINNKWYELNSSTTVLPLNRPFLGFGWGENGDTVFAPETANVFHQMLALSKCVMAGLGSDSARLGFFFENNISQDGRLWWHQPLALSYTQAIRSFYPQFYTGGATLLDGDLYIDQTTETKNSKVFWTGSPNCLLIVRKNGTEYLFIMAYFTLTNYIGQNATYDYTVTVDGFTHDFSARQQGDIIYWDSTNPLVYEQRDFFHQQSHPTYWAANITPPVIITPFGDLDRTLACNDTAGLAAALALFPTAIDTTDPNPTMIENPPVITNNGVCPYTITRSWYFIDLDLNISTTFYQVITIFVPTTPTMALVERNTLTTTPSATGLLITDATGLYANPGNTGGYETPNPSVSDFISYVSTITVPNSSTYLATGTAYPIDLFGIFPTTNESVEQTITSAQLGFGANTIIATGIYKLYTVASTATDDYTYTNYYLFFPRVTQAIAQLRLAGGCDCCNAEDYQAMTNMADLICLQWSYGQQNRALCTLQELINLLGKFGKTDL